MWFDLLIAVFITAWVFVLLVPVAIVTSVGTLAAVAAALLLASKSRRPERGAESSTR